MLSLHRSKSIYLLSNRRIRINSLDPVQRTDIFLWVNYNVKCYYYYIDDQVGDRKLSVDKIRLRKKRQFHYLTVNWCLLFPHPFMSVFVVLCYCIIKDCCYPSCIELRCVFHMASQLPHIIMKKGEEFLVIFSLFCRFTHKQDNIRNKYFSIVVGGSRTGMEVEVDEGGMEQINGTFLPIIIRQLSQPTAVRK